MDNTNPVLGDSGSANTAVSQLRWPSGTRGTQVSECAPRQPECVHDACSDISNTTQSWPPPDQPSQHIRTHTPQADHSELHGRALLQFVTCSTERCSAPTVRRVSVNLISNSITGHASQDASKVLWMAASSVASNSAAVRVGSNIGFGRAQATARSVRNSGDPKTTRRDRCVSASAVTKLRAVLFIRTHMSQSNSAVARSLTPVGATRVAPKLKRANIARSLSTISIGDQQCPAVPPNE